MNFHHTGYQEGVEADVILCSAAINACAVGSSWQEAFQILDLLSQWSLAVCSADSFRSWIFVDLRVCFHLLFYCALFMFNIDFLFFLGCRVLLAIDPPAFLARAFLPDSIMLNSVISACEKAAEWQRALQLLEARLFLGFVMTTRGIVPDPENILNYICIHTYMIHVSNALGIIVLYEYILVVLQGLLVTTSSDDWCWGNPYPGKVGSGGRTRNHIIYSDYDCICICDF